MRQLIECDCGAEYERSEPLPSCDCGKRKCEDCEKVCEGCGHVGCEGCMLSTIDGWFCRDTDENGLDYSPCYQEWLVEDMKREAELDAKLGIKPGRCITRIG